MGKNPENKNNNVWLFHTPILQDLFNGTLNPNPTKWPAYTVLWWFYFQFFNLMMAQKWYTFTRNLLWIAVFSRDSNVQYDTLPDAGQQQ